MQVVKSLLVFGVVVSFGCTGTINTQAAIEPCTMEWFSFVEAKVPTGDGQGHGPDVGSMEWRSVIEFRLGIRGDSSVPSLDSNQWCSYINERITSHGT
jgi:hypothetical protein